MQCFRQEINGGVSFMLVADRINLYFQLLEAESPSILPVELRKGGG